MILTELIKIFKKDGDLNNFIEKNSLSPDSEIIFIYMEKPLGIEREIKFLELEKTDDGSEYEINGITYCNLVDFYYFTDFMEDSKTYKNRDLTEEELAEILLNYCINDA